MNAQRPRPATDGFARVPKDTFRSRIADSLRNAILGGDIAPGSQLVETALAEQFGVSRGPLREAIRQLIEEGILETVPYTGTYVIDISVKDVDEIYSIRRNLETFAFELVWDRRGAAFRNELHRRHEALTATIDAGDDKASILAELSFHGAVYEATGHSFLLHVWHGLRGRLQLYWAAHHRAHGLRGPRRDGHDTYLRLALGDDWEAMRGEIESHMRRGAEQTKAFLDERERRQEARP
ncbi:GntR family transcriptional regulator [Methylobacterium sp. SyP6R]|uniref:GntR family transcriptional regulator n=1 Tax=Methylobacterium sp. SyP6R TaxID=2718876 RepID=UPI001F2469BC|nr:GntR family transcriptional regulator [Methylobacterium sp. SyP6R]MCF4127731.1 GntR family transcriptional regulator [Methylobacterium sp. SyP6R]